jgi:hypothetical protein
VPAAWLGGEFGGAVLSSFGITEFPAVCLDLVNAPKNLTFLVAFCGREVNGLRLLGRVYLTGARANLFAVGHDGPTTVKSVDDDNLLGLFLLGELTVYVEKNDPLGAFVSNSLLLDGLFVVFVSTGCEANGPSKANDSKQNEPEFLHGGVPELPVNQVIGCRSHNVSVLYPLQS